MFDNPMQSIFSFLNRNENLKMQLLIANAQFDRYVQHIKSLRMYYDTPSKLISYLCYILLLLQTNDCTCTVHYTYAF